MNQALIYIKKGKLRRKIILELNKAQTATELAKKLNTHRSSISRTLLNLAKRDLVTCLNPQDDRERYYELTIKGNDIRKQILSQ